MITCDSLVSILTDRNFNLKTNEIIDIIRNEIQPKPKRANLVSLPTDKYLYTFGFKCAFLNIETAAPEFKSWTNFSYGFDDGLETFYEYIRSNSLPLSLS